MHTFLMLNIFKCFLPDATQIKSINTHPDRTSINQSVGKDAASDDPPPGEGMTYANGCFSGRRLGVPPKVGVSTEVDLFFDSPQPSGT